MSVPDESEKSLEDFNDWLSHLDAQRRRALGIAFAEILLPLMNEYFEQVLAVEEERVTAGAGNDALATAHGLPDLTGGRHGE